MKWDLFISHASEDKKDVAEPLVKLLEDRGLSVWYDRKMLTLGDSLRRSIEEALANCKYGVVIISNDSLRKEWPKKELDGLLAMEDGSGKRILPVYHQITHAKLLKLLPILADKLAVSTSQGLEHVADEICRVFEAKGSSKTTKKSPKSKKDKTIDKQPAHDFAMIGDVFVPVESFLQKADGKFELIVLPESTQEAVALSKLYSSESQRNSKVPFAIHNEAYDTHVESVRREHTATRLSCTIVLVPVKQNGSYFGADEASYSTNGKTFSPDQFARMRAGRILINDPPFDPTPRAFDTSHMMESFLQGHRLPIKECVIQSVYLKTKADPNWKEYARLRAIYSLILSGAVDEVIQLKIGPVSKNETKVQFAGQRRPRYSNGEPTLIEVNGTCSLS